MNAPTDKDYIDAKLQAVMEKINGDIRAHQLATDARLERIERKIEDGQESLRAEFNLKLAELESNLKSDFQRTLIDVMKWMIGAMAGLTAISVTVSSVLFIRLAPKDDAPVMPRVSAVSNPRPAPAARGAQTLSANSTTVVRAAMLPATRPATGVSKTARRLGAA